ncbi:MAG: AAA family ATPase [Pseudomonadota bacterium]
MKLRSIEIKNFRSLEQVKLAPLKNFNVLIGKNNSGKSSVFSALTFLHDVLQGKADPTDVLTKLTGNKSLEIELCFLPTSTEREDLINRLINSPSRNQSLSWLYDSQFYREFTFTFRSAIGRAGTLQLTNLVATAQDGLPFKLIGFDSIPTSSNDGKSCFNIDHFAAANMQSLPKHWNAATLYDQFRNTAHIFNIPPNLLQPDSTPSIHFPGLQAVVNLLFDFLNHASFFQPFRHSEAAASVIATPKLNRDGSNLAQRLHSINSNNRSEIDAIAKAISTALPDIGQLQTPLLDNSSSTSIQFISPNGYHVALKNMGGGIEQLLMVFAVLYTTPNDHAIFLEEPETHLHPGAQRFLIEQLQRDGRQVFLTTHSPIFINASHADSIHQVSIRDGRTRIEYVSDYNLAAVLSDIGAKNSDVLLSNAVVFVEGEGDKAVLEIFARKLNLQLSESNIIFLPMGGGNASHLKIRSDVLTGLSSETHIPHLIVIDRDERPEKEVTKLRKNLGDKLHVLSCRELENYLLEPSALLARMREKAKDIKATKEALESVSSDQVADWINEAASKLFEHVLLRKISTEVGGLQGGFLTRKFITEQSKKPLNSASLFNQLDQEIQRHFTASRMGLDLKTIIQRNHKTLSNQWKKPINHLKLAPGEEIINAVFGRYGFTYNKAVDATKIAEHIHVDHVPDEIKQLLGKAKQLVA